MAIPLHFPHSTVCSKNSWETGNPISVVWWGRKAGNLRMTGCCPRMGSESSALDFWSRSLEKPVVRYRSLGPLASDCGVIAGILSSGGHWIVSVSGFWGIASSVLS